MKKGVQSLYALFISLIALFLILPFVSATWQNFDDAQLINSSGMYQGSITPFQKDYYKVDLKPGQMTYVELRAKGCLMYATWSVNFFDDRKEFLDGSDSAWCMNDNSDVDHLIKTFWASGEKEEKIFYIIVYAKDWNSGDVKEMGKFPEYSLNVTFEDRYDLADQNKLKTDAGPDFDSAMDIKAGFNQRGWLLGKDDNDFYKISLKKDQNLSIVMKPNVHHRMAISIYDQNRINRAGTESPNDGAIVSATFNSTENQIVYIEVTDVTWNGRRSMTVEDQLEQDYVLDVSVLSKPNGFFGRLWNMFKSIFGKK
ncbi:MAG: hypothetical protein NTX24_00815 [Candidatus Pacearchaeota archaeon]|nr:hypothetical protein [Candidatus Pacearchaeota archaeon]